MTAGLNFLISPRGSRATAVLLEPRLGADAVRPVELRRASGLEAEIAAQRAQLERGQIERRVEAVGVARAAAEEDEEAGHHRFTAGAPL